MKMCTKCETEYPATTKYFYRNKQCKDGLHGHCKVCKSLRHKEYMSDPIVGDRVRKGVRAWQKGVGKEKYKEALKKFGASPKKILYRRNRKIVADYNDLPLDEALEKLEQAKKEREANPLTWDNLKLRPFKDGRNKHLKETSV